MDRALTLAAAAAQPLTRATLPPPRPGGHAGSGAGGRRPARTRCRGELRLPAVGLRLAIPER